MSNNEIFEEIQESSTKIQEAFESKLLEFSLSELRKIMQNIKQDQFQYEVTLKRKFTFISKILMIFPPTSESLDAINAEFKETTNTLKIIYLNCFEDIQANLKGIKDGIFFISISENLYLFKKNFENIKIITDIAIENPELYLVEDPKVLSEIIYDLKLFAESITT